MASGLRRSLSVPVAKLRRTCDPRVFKFATTASAAPLEGTVGQDRAVSALDFGLSIEAGGFHVFVAGPTGTGRSTELRTQVERIAKTRPAPRDWCYVLNFEDETRPRALGLPAGCGMKLSQEVDEMVATVRIEIPRAFESDEYARRRDAVNRDMLAQRERLFESLEKEASARGIGVSATPMGISTVPLADGKPLTKEQYDVLTDDQKHQIQERTGKIDSIIAQMMPQLRRLDRTTAQLLAEVDRQVMQSISGPLLDELKREYEGEPAITQFIERLGEDMVTNIDAFRAGEEQQQPPMPGLPAPARADGVLHRYKVNVIVSNAADSTAPVVVEENPTYYQMFGRVDYRSTFGSMVTDHTMIKPGALHRANGGFLIVQAIDVLTQPFVWLALKRALRSGQARLENIGEQVGLIPTATLSPEPIPLDVKVAMIGNGQIHRILQTADEDFQKLFKAKADFATDVERTPATVQLYGRFVARQVLELGMRPFDRGALARVVEHSSRIVADQDKLSLRMMDIVDLLVEADYWACDHGKKTVTARHVDEAIERKVYRSSLIEDRVQEFITNGTIKVDVSGSVAGQVNGLSVYDLGDYAFGRPSRITARVSLGRGQVINIEREVQRSGSAHSKGFLIINGYVNGKFAHRQPLSFAASITFEQVYDEVDGDSASSTELYALLSAITDVPLRQGIAVTGSVNQLGEIQAIGGVNHKVEGFYEVCKAKGLTGDQGVMIPRDNVHNLMLKPEVVDAVRRGKFHIYAVSSIEQGIEILTDVPAGRLRKNGTYAEGTLFRKVTDALEAMTKRAIEVNRAAAGRDAIGPPAELPRAAKRPSEARRKRREDA